MATASSHPLYRKFANARRLLELRCGGIHAIDFWFDLPELTFSEVAETSRLVGQWLETHRWPELTQRQAAEVRARLLYGMTRVGAAKAHPTKAEVADARRLLIDEWHLHGPDFAGSMAEEAWDRGYRLRRSS